MLKINLSKKTLNFLSLSLIILWWFIFMANNVFAWNINTQRTAVIYNHLNTKYEKLNLDEQEKKRETMNNLFHQIKKKVKTVGLEELIDMLIQKAERKIAALKKYSDSLEVDQDDNIFEVIINWKKQTINLNSNSFTLSPNSNWTIQKNIGSDMPSLRSHMLDLINQERSNKGLENLILNEKLNISSQLHAKYMSDTDDFAHTTKAGLAFNTRIKNAGYNEGTIWENIAWNQKTVEQVMDSWMNSDGHRSNILNPKFTEIGIWFSDYYRVQNFGG